MALLKRFRSLSMGKAERKGYKPEKGSTTEMNGQKINASLIRSMGSGASSSSDDFENDIAEVYLMKDNDSGVRYPMGVRVRISEDLVDGALALEPRGKLVDEVDFASCAYGLGLRKGNRLCTINGQELPSTKPIVFCVSGELIQLGIRVRCNKTGEWRRQTSLVDNTITVIEAETHECADEVLQWSFSEDRYIKSGFGRGFYLTYENDTLFFNVNKGRGTSLFTVISLSEVLSNDNAVPVIIQHNQTKKCLFLNDQGAVGMMDVNTDTEDFSSHQPYVFKKRGFAVGTGNYVLESYSSGCRGVRMLLGCKQNGSRWNAVGVNAANPGNAITAFTLMPKRRR